MSLYRRKNSPYWYVSLNVNGRRVRRPTGATKKSEAQRYHDKLISDVWEQAKLDIPAGYRWTDAVKAWLHAAPRGDEDRYRLKWIGLHLGNPALGDITAATLTSLLNVKRAEGAALGTLTRYSILIHAILNRARRTGWVATVPRTPSFKSPPGRVRWLTLEEWQRLEPLLPAHLRQLARFTLATGLRRHNATHLRWDKVDMQRAVAWVSANEVKQRQAIGVPLNQDALTVLTEQVDKHLEWVFPYQGYPVTQTATRAWRDALTKAGIEDFTWHDLRHTWASWHVMNGTRLEELQRLGGWKTLTMVTRYTHLSPEHLAGVAGNVRPVSVTKV